MKGGYGRLWRAVAAKDVEIKDSYLRREVPRSDIVHSDADILSTELVGKLLRNP